MKEKNHNIFVISTFSDLLIETIILVASVNIRTSLTNSAHYYVEKKIMAKKVNKVTVTYFRYAHLLVINNFQIFVKSSSKYYLTVPVVFFSSREENVLLFEVLFFNPVNIFKFGITQGYFLYGSLGIRQKLTSVQLFV